MAQPIDLRSDTVTQPSKAMRTAMSRAAVGDDVFGEDPTVNRLEAYSAELFGKEAALFLPSGTMANQAAVRSWAKPGGEVILEYGSHIFNLEGASAAGLSGVQLHPLQGKDGVITAEQVKRAIRGDNYHLPPTELVWLENTHNLAGGTVFPIDEIRRIRELTLEREIPLHLDGARIFNAVVATGIEPSEYGALFDSLSFCLSKGLGAPVGSVLVGDREFIRRCHYNRKRLGGGMRQAGIIAAGGLYALDNNIDRLAEDHRRAEELARALAEIPDIRIDPDRVETNIILFDLMSEFQVAPFLTALEERGVLMLPLGERRIRAATHLDVSDRDLKTVIEVIKKAVPEV